MPPTREAHPNPHSHADSVSIPSPIDPRLSDKNIPTTSSDIDSASQALRTALQSAIYPSPDHKQQQEQQHSQQLAGLVQAAAAAAGQESAWTQGEGEDGIDSLLDPHHGHALQHPHQVLGSYATHIHGMPMEPPTDLNNGSDTEQHTGRGLKQSGSRPARSNTHKRKRASSEDGEQQDDNYNGSANSSDEKMHDPLSQQALAEARAVGIRSAAALFRLSSSSRKKYTRPPMAELFGNLQLTPESFVRLQALAKNYMLNPAHPERRDCVGQRGKGDGDMVKLALWNCVEEFLEQDDIGSRFFGENVQPAESTMIWPNEKTKVIKAVVPLCRRMVTNERQREYANRTRKGDQPVVKRKKVNHDDQAPGMVSDAAQSQQLQHADMSYYQHTLMEGATMVSETHQPPADSTAVDDDTHDLHQADPTAATEHPQSQSLHIVPLHNDVRYAPTFALLATEASTLAALYGQVNSYLTNMGKEAIVNHQSADGHGSVSTKVHMPDGLVKVDDDEEWNVNLDRASQVEWMDGLVRVIVDVKT